MNIRSLEAILAALEAINIGQLDQRIVLPDEDDPLVVGIANELNIFSERAQEVNEFAIALSNGELKIPAPKWSNFLAGGLKRLQANLIHLVWKVKQIEKGNYFQQIDFAGDLSDTFNQMVLTLHKREDALKFQIEERKKLYELMLTIFDVIKDPIFILDKISMNMAYQNDNGRLFIEDADPEELSGMLKYFTALSDEDTHLTEIERPSDSRWYQVALNRFELPDERNGLLVVMTDITEWKVSQAQLIQYANLDELSGALNRRAGFEAFEKLIAQLQPPDTLFVCFIDIDGLKTINDVYGHSEGDALIRTLSTILNHNVRKNDVFCRYGGDEFFLVFPNCSRDIVNGIIQRIDEDVTQHNLTSNLPYECKFSYGIHVIQAGENITARTALTMADKQMYDMKKEQHKKKKKT